MEIPANPQERLLTKIQQLSLEKLAEVETFVDFISQRDRIDQPVTQIAAQLSEPVFNQIWDNSDDAEYDNL